MHLAIFRDCSAVRSVVHAHPPTATALAVVGRGIPGDTLPEVTSQLGEVPVVPYSRSGGAELAERVAGAVLRHPAVLLANHGAVTTGVSPLQAYLRMETVEHAARIIVLASLAGNIEKLSAAEVAALRGAGYDA
jgi:L-fuculose-phosphate aldolase